MNKTFTDYFGKLWRNSAVVVPSASSENEMYPSSKRVEKQSIAKVILLLIILQFFAGSPVLAQQQNITIKGVVADNNDSETLIGVSILDAQRKSLGVTGLDGSFTLNIPKETSVSFSMVT